MFGWIHRTCIRGNRFCHLNMKAGTIARLSHRLYTSLGARRTVVEAVARSPSTDWIKVLRVMATAAAAAVTERNLKMASSASTSLHHTETSQNSHASTLKRLSVCNILNMIFQLLFFLFLPSFKYFLFLLAFLFCLFNWFLTTISLALVHERVPDRTHYGPLPDVFLDNIPAADWALDVSEILIIISTTSCMILLFFHKYR